MTRRQLLALSAAAGIAGAARKRYRVGVIGHTGRGNYGHGLDVVWQAFDSAEIVAVADPVPNAVADPVSNRVSDLFPDAVADAVAN